MNYRINRCPNLVDMPAGIPAPAIIAPPVEDWSKISALFERAFKRNVRENKDGSAYNTNVPVNMLSKDKLERLMGVEYIESVENKKPIRRLEKPDNRAKIAEQLMLGQEKIILRRLLYHGEYTALTIDYDNDGAIKVDPKDILLKLNGYGWKYIAYSSFSNFKKGYPKFRIILPLDTEISTLDVIYSVVVYGLGPSKSGHEYDHYMSGAIDPTGYQKNRYFYLPAAPSARREQVEAFVPLDSFDITQPWFMKRDDGIPLNVTQLYRMGHFKKLPRISYLKRAKLNHDKKSKGK